MSEGLIKIRMVILCVLSIASLLVWIPIISVAGVTTENGVLTVRFLDVGQGDAIHVITPDGYELLIDGGPSAGVLREFAKGRSFFDTYIDIVVATHPDTDHVAGLVDILKRYEVGMVLETAVEHDAVAARAFKDAVDTVGVHRILAQAGQTIQLGASTTVRILSPYGDTSNLENNAASIVTQIVYGDIEFMLTGDVPSGIEEYLVSAYGELLESEVLKLGHHGSKTSSSEIFLKQVQPLYAVVSAGVGNRYGHPHPDVVTRVKQTGSRLLSTAEQGSVIFETDGNTVWLK